MNGVGAHFGVPEALNAQILFDIHIFYAAGMQIERHRMLYILEQAFYIRIGFFEVADKIIRT